MTRNKKIRRKTKEVLLMELNQLHEPDALFQLKKEEMSPDQRKILMYLLFLKEKCD